MTLSLRNAVAACLLVTIASPTIAATTVASPVTLPAECVAKYFGPLQPLVSAICKLGT
jgi:hypothetical protein